MARDASLSVDGARQRSDRGELLDLLQLTSRTFALTIPLLPEPISTEVGVAYLLFRIIDTFEDATRWPADRRRAALEEFIGLLDDAPLDAPQIGNAAAAATERWLADPPVEHAGYLQLLGAAPRVLDWCQRLAPAARQQMRRDVTRSAEGMIAFIGRTDGQGVLQLETLADLRAYCFVVAGIVGEMLTELFLLGQPQLAGAAAALRERAVCFGEALQLVNILKDARPDADAGRVYLPRQVELAEVFMLARSDLRVAVEYTELLRAAGADRGLVAFNALNTSLAIATLRLLRDRGFGAKLTRLQVTGLLAQVMRAVETGGPLFDLTGLGAA
jgi:farnesyl-diphosphate farnesyltransferase